MKISEVIKPLSAVGAAIKNTASPESRDGWYPAYSASGQDVWLPDYRFDCAGIVVSAVGARCGKAFKADGKWNICANTHPLFVDESKALRDYCWYMVNNEKWWIKGGTAQPFVKVKDSLSRDHTFPTLTEQKTIVKRLNYVQELIRQRESQLRQLDTLVKARFVEMFGVVDLAPQYAEWVKLSELGEIVSGSTPKTAISEYWNGSICWISPAELADMSGVINDSVKKITENGKNSCSLRLMPVGTVILSSRAPIGKVAILGKEMCCNQGFKNIVCSEKVLPEYLYYLLGYNTIFLNSLGRGATFKEISKQIVGNIKIPLPSIKKQKQFASLTAQVDKSKFAILATIRELHSISTHMKMLPIP